MDRLTRKLRALLEGNVVSFPSAAEREKRKKGYVDVQTQVTNLAQNMAASFNEQNEAEKHVADKADKIRTDGACQRRKFIVPFIMKGYQSQVNPIQALIWAVEEYLESGDENKDLNKEQARFAYRFLDSNLEEMMAAVDADLAAADELRNETLDMDIPLPGYAAQPAVRLHYDLKGIRTSLEYFRQYDGIFQHPERTWSRKQARVRDELLSEDAVVGAEPFDRTNTNMAHYNDMMRMPEYYEEEKGVIFMIIEMSPDEYLDRCKKGFARHQDFHGDLVATRDREKVAKYAQQMLAGDKFPMPVLSYENLGFSQEGIHRVLAAKMAGYDKVPVLLSDNTKVKKDKIRKWQKQKGGGLW